MQLLLASSPRVLRPGAAAAPLAPRDAAMLAWLALEGPTPRNRLAALLWPESPAESARNTLRQRLFQLKKQFGDALVAGQGVLTLAEGVAHDLHDADEVLGGVALEAEGELAQWLQQQRGRRRERMRQSLAELADMAEKARDWADALTHAQELLALEPLSEEAHRRVIRLHYLAGDRAAALLAFDACERTLKDEIGTRPGEDTLVLLRTVMAGDRAAGAAPRVLPTAMLRPPRLVGREAELRATLGAWQAGRVAWVSGDAGVGKSRLLQDAFGARAGVVGVAARPGDAAVPYSTLARLLRAVLERAPGRAPATPGEVSRLLPDLAGGPAPPPASQPAAQRLALQRGVAGLLHAVAVGAEPALQGLVVDDLHFADDASLDMLAALVQSPSAAGSEAAPDLCWAFAARPAEGSARMQALADGLLETQRLQPVALRPLGLAQMVEFVEALGLDGLDHAALAQALHRHTGGNPLFALETLRQAWLEDGLGADGGPARLPRPEGVARLIERRLARLSPQAARLARCAALADADFSIDLATHVMGVAAIDLADAWTELEAAQVIHDGAFAHDLIYEAALASVPAPIARHLHAQIATFLDRRGGEPARLARHWAEARAWPQAAAAYREAAARAQHGAHIAEGVALLEQAARCADAAGDGGARFDALCERARVLAGFEFGEQAAAALDDLQAAAATPRQRLQAEGERLKLHTMRYELSAVRERAPAVLAEARALGDFDIELRAAVQLAGALSDARRAADAVALLEPYAEPVEAAGSVDQRFEFWMALALARDYADRLRDAIEAWDRVLGLPGLQARADLTWQAQANRAATQSKMGLVSLSAEAGLQALRAARLSGDLPRVRIARTASVVAHRLRDIGRYAEALALLEESSEAWHVAPVPAERAWIDHRLAVLYQQLGQPERAVPLLRAELEGLHPGLALMRQVHRADLARHTGGNGLPLLRSALAIIPDANDIYHRIATLFATWLVPPDEGEALGASLAVWAASRERYGVALAGHVRAAACGLSLGAAARALPHAEAALRLAREHQPDTYYLPEMWLVAARAFDALGRGDEAAQAVREGRAWIVAVHDAHVPAPFRSSFLERNPVNRELLAWASRLGA